jgi:hypothetical protein
MANLHPLGALAILSLVIACSSDGASTGAIAREGGAQGSGGSTGGTVNCDSVCPAVVAAKCTGGPVDQADCVSGCQSILAGKCASKYQALYQCGGTSPKYTCDSMTRVSVSGCETVANDLYTCLAGG